MHALIPYQAPLANYTPITPLDNYPVIPDNHTHSLPRELSLFLQNTQPPTPEELRSLEESILEREWMRYAKTPEAASQTSGASSLSGVVNSIIEWVTSLENPLTLIGERLSLLFGTNPHQKTIQLLKQTLEQLDQNTLYLPPGYMADYSGLREEAQTQRSALQALRQQAPIQNTSKEVAFDWTQKVMAQTVLSEKLAPKLNLEKTTIRAELQGKLARLRTSNPRLSNDAGTARWRSFVNGISSAIDDNEIPFYRVSMFLDRYELVDKALILPTWLAFFFSPAAQAEKNPVKLIDKILFTDFQTEIPMQFESKNGIISLREKLECFFYTLDRFSQPESLECSLEELSCTVHLAAQRQLLFTRFHPLVNLAAISEARLLVRTLKNAIEIVNNAVYPPSTKKAEALIRLLYMSHDLFCSWSSYAMQTKQQHPDSNQPWPYESYLQEMSDLMRKIDPKTTLISNSGGNFNLATSQFGLSPDLQNSIPVTVRDFANLLNENLNTVLNIFENRIISPKLAGATLPQKFVDKLNAMNNKPGACRIGARTDEFDMEFIYHVEEASSHHIERVYFNQEYGVHTLLEDTVPSSKSVDQQDQAHEDSSLR